MNFIVQTLQYEIFKEAQKINELFEAGMEVLHIKKPLHTYSQMASLLNGIDGSFHKRIVVHSHFSLLRKYSLKGIHVDSKDLSGFFYHQYLKCLKSKYNISLSTTISKINSEIVTDDLVDYSFFGPIYTKYSEEMIMENVNLKEIKASLSSVSKDIYAQGCFTIENVQAVRASNFKGVVFQSMLWKSEDILSTFKMFQLSFENSKSSNLGTNII